MFSFKHSQHLLHIPDTIGKGHSAQQGRAVITLGISCSPFSINVREAANIILTIQAILQSFSLLLDDLLES